MEILKQLTIPQAPVLSRPLTKAEQKTCFFENAVYICGQQLIPEHRILECFGDYLAPWLVECRRGSYVTEVSRGYQHHKYGPDKHYVRCSNGSEDIYLYTEMGFKNIADKVQLDILIRECAMSDARCAMLDAEEDYDAAEAEREAEKERKRRERRAKKAAKATVTG